MVKERAIMERARPQIIAAKIGEYVSYEVLKGCSPEIFSSPVTLEPVYNSLYNLTNNFQISSQVQTFEDIGSLNQLTRLKLWISPEHKFDWNKSELFIKQLQYLHHQVCFEIWGNERVIVFGILCLRVDIPTIIAAFRGIYQECEITEVGDLEGLLAVEHLPDTVCFKDYYPSPPYSHLFTNPQELGISPLETLMINLTQLPETVFGVYQVLFATVDPSHNWHENVELLYDIEYARRLNNGYQAMPQRFSQQGPAGDLRQMAGDVSSKAHNDKPFLAASIRCAVVGAEDSGVVLLQSISSFMNLFQHGGRPLNFLTEKQFQKTLTHNQLFEMFVSGFTYRHGFILNSMELSGLVHLPSIGFADQRNLPISKLEVKPGTTAPKVKGSTIGTYLYTGILHKINLSDSSRRSTHLIGTPGYGKTTAQEHLIMDDIKHGHGVAVIDPHGGLSERLLSLIPQKYVDKTIYLDFGNDDWIPAWNPLSINSEVEKGTATAEFLFALKSFISTTGWGDRLEYILKQVIFSVLHLPDATILDVINILRRKPNHLEKIQREILAAISSENTRDFWLNDFKNYPKDAFSPPINKLDKLFATNNLSCMLSNPQNKINFREIMNDGSVLIVNLANLSLSVQSVLGCFILTLLQLNTLARENIQDKEQKRFDIHIDEVHRFAISNTMESFIEEGRKFNVTVSLAHQRNSQFDYKKIDAFGGVGTTIVFKVNSKDAAHFVKGLQGKIKVSEITNLEKYEAIVCSGSDVHKVKTLEPLQIQAENFKEEIIKRSHAKYYTSVSEIKKILAGKTDGIASGFQVKGIQQPEHLQKIKEFHFDEF